MLLYKNTQILVGKEQINKNFINADVNIVGGTLINEGLKF